MARVTKIGPRKGSPRPHMRTHPEVLKHRWSKENNPHTNGTFNAKAVGRLPSHNITAAYRDGLMRQALLDGKKAGVSVAEAIAHTDLEEAMNGRDTSIARILERTEGKVADQHQITGAGGKKLEVHVVFDEYAGPRGGSAPAS